MKVALETLGCKLNQAETESLARQLAAAGHEVVADVSEADVYVLNSCTVTATADAKARQSIRAAHQLNPKAFVVAAGCYAEREAAALAALTGVGLVVSNRDKPRLLSLIEERLGRGGAIRDKAGLPAGLRTRAFIKVQEGCRGSCSYCIVPTVRPQEKSVPAADVIDEINQRVSQGTQEIVLTGTEVGAYSDGTYDLSGLLGRVLTATAVPRVRVSSLQPNEVSSELLTLWSNRRLCRHFHLSLQSGSDAVLRAMRRRYSAPQYFDAASRIRSVLPDAALTTDVIVGFPGETDEMFKETLEACRILRFARIHVFPFSARPGTEAARVPAVVPEPTKRLRTKQMLSLAVDSAREFRVRFEGKVRPVLWERQDSRGQWSGLTDNYIPVTCRSDENLENTITDFTVR